MKNDDDNYVYGKVGIDADNNNKYDILEGINNDHSDWIFNFLHGVCCILYIITIQLVQVILIILILCIVIMLLIQVMGSFLKVN